MLKFIRKKFNFIDRTKCYRVSVPVNVEKELENTLRDLGLTEEEIKKTLSVRNINS